TMPAPTTTTSYVGTRRILGPTGSEGRCPSILHWLSVTATLSHLIASYGLVAILVLMAAESCGLPFPSEVIMPVAGVLAASGHLDFAAAVLAGAFGNLIGSLVAYG